MALSAGFRAIRRWASSTQATRTAPDDQTLTPPLVVADGWGDTFSADSGDTPRRGVFNWLFGTITDALVDLRNYGVLPWDVDVDTLQGGVRQGSDGVQYRALSDNGPSFPGTVTDPTTAGNAVWLVISGSVGVPSAPRAPTAATTDPLRLLWEWNCPLDGGAEISDFDFEWRIQGGQWSAAVTVTNPRHEIGPLLRNRTYEARALARNSEGDGGWSAVGSAVAQAAIPGGGPSLALRADPGDGDAALDWLEPDANGDPISSYVVQWRTAGQVFAAGRQMTVTATAATVPNLPNGVEHFFQVRAVNGQGNGAWSNEASAIPTAPAPDQAIPDTAEAPSGVAGNGQGTWAWLPPSDNGSDISGFEFRFRPVTSPVSSWTTRSVTLASRTETGLVNGQSYEAQVRARNGVGLAAAWSPSGTLTPAAEVPDRVQHVELDNTTSGIAASWGVPDDNGAAISRYDVQVANNSAFTAASTVQVTGTSHTVTGLVNGNTRWVRVRAVNDAGNGGWSPGVSLTRDDGMAVPDAPVGLVGEAVRPLRVNWLWRSGGDNGSDISGFQVQTRDEGAAWVAADIVDVDTGFYQAEATAATGMDARVRAVNGVGTGPWSATANIAASDLLAAYAARIDLAIDTDTTWGLPFGNAVVVVYWGGALGTNGRLNRNGVNVVPTQRVASGGGITLNYYEFTDLVAADVLRPVRTSILALFQFGRVYPQPETA